MGNAFRNFMTIFIANLNNIKTKFYVIVYITYS